MARGVPNNNLWVLKNKTEVMLQVGGKPLEFKTIGDFREWLVASTKPGDVYTPFRPLGDYKLTFTVQCVGEEDDQVEEQAAAPVAEEQPPVEAPVVETKVVAAAPASDLPETPWPDEEK